jgi:hypothetical protein
MPDEQKLFADTLKEAAAKATEAIEASERILAGQFRKLGMTVLEPDREAFRKAAILLHNDASVGAGWTQAQYDEHGLTPADGDATPKIPSVPEPSTGLLVLLTTAAALMRRKRAA